MYLLHQSAVHRCLDLMDDQFRLRRSGTPLRLHLCLLAVFSRRGRTRTSNRRRVLIGGGTRRIPPSNVYWL